MSELIKDLKLERVQGSEAILQYSNFDYWVNWEDVEEIVKEYEEQQQLNDNQQKYLETLKHNYRKLDTFSDAIFYGLINYEERYAFKAQEFFQVLEVFAKWVQEMEGEI